MEPEEIKTIQASVGITGDYAGTNFEIHESDSYNEKPSVDDESC